MNYNEALNFIYEKQRLGSVPGLSRIEKLLAQMGDPQNDLRIIHIAGTNGKGTVANSIANALIKAGYKVGLFTSPWVIDYREQIQINGEFISGADFAKYVTENINAEATEFELITAIMYKYFSDEAVDYAVVECGMGGREDATNVEKSNLSVITPISLDHTDFLGETVEAIAKEKSGILRKNSPCILYGDEFKDIFEPECKNLIISDKSDNLSIVNTVLKYLNLQPLNEVVRLPARQERINGILIDGGHNVSAALFLEPVISDEIAVIGMMKDKDVEGYLSIIAPKCKKIIATSPNNPRSLSAKELASRARKYCKCVEIVNDPEDAVKRERITLICGSFYLAREVRKYLF